MNASALLIRNASDRDAPRLHRLAVLDSASDLEGPALIAERDGRLVAAVELDNGRAIADPFERSAGAVRLLELHREHLEEAA